MTVLSLLPGGKIFLMGQFVGSFRLCTALILNQDIFFVNKEFY